MPKRENKKSKKKKESSGKWLFFQLLPELLVGLGVFSILISGSHWYLQQRSLSLNAELVSTYQTQAEENEVRPVHIKIDWFVDVPIDEESYQDGQWTISEENASYLTQSARPGEQGNIIIYGHNKRSILGNIRALKSSETITLTLSDGTTRDYKISLITEVDPSRVEYLRPTDTETLTIYTCSGFLDSKRFIVQAVPVEEEPD